MHLQKLPCSEPSGYFTCCRPIVIGPIRKVLQRKPPSTLKLAGRPKETGEKYNATAGQVPFVLNWGVILTAGNLDFRVPDVEIKSTRWGDRAVPRGRPSIGEVRV